MEEDIHILIADRIAQEGIDLLRAQLPEAHIDADYGLKPEELKSKIGTYTALIVRSETQVTGEILAAADSLKIVGRAGVGVDNIDIEAATRRGIMVVNSPTGNIVAAAEHTIAMLMARPATYLRLAAARRRVNGKRVVSWVLKCATKYSASLVLDVGAEVARRAQGLEMQVIALIPM